MKNFFVFFIFSIIKGLSTQKIYNSSFLSFLKIIENTFILGAEFFSFVPPIPTQVTEGQEITFKVTNQNDNVLVCRYVHILVFSNYF